MMKGLMLISVCALLALGNGDILNEDESALKNRLEILDEREQTEEKREDPEEPSCALLYYGFIPKEDTDCMSSILGLFYVDKERDCSTNCHKMSQCGAFTMSKADINRKQFIRCILYDTCKERNGVTGIDAYTLVVRNHELYSQGLQFDGFKKMEQMSCQGAQDTYFFAKKEEDCPKECQLRRKCTAFTLSTRNHKGMDLLTCELFYKCEKKHGVSGTNLFLRV